MSSDPSLIIRAARFAKTAHAGQKRKFVDDPYIVHPARVAGRVAIHPLADDAMVAAAFLHDVVEDTPCTLDRIEREFGPRVASLVGQLTKPEALDGATRAEKKGREIEHNAAMSRDAKIIKMLDRIDNLHDVRDAPADFAELYRRESHALAAAIGDADPELKQELLECIERFSGPA